MGSRHRSWVQRDRRRWPCAVIGNSSLRPLCGCDRELWCFDHNGTSKTILEPSTLGVEQDREIPREQWQRSQNESDAADDPSPHLYAVPVCGDHPDLHHAIARRLAGGRPEPGEVADRPDDVGGPTDHLQHGLNIVREVEERDDQRRGGGHYERHEIDERGVDNERNDPRGEARIVSAGALAHWAGRSRT